MKKRLDKNLFIKVMDNLNRTPVGQVLKKIAFLPEMRQKKVLLVHQQLTSGNYGLSERLDVVLDEVLKGKVL